MAAASPRKNVEPTATNWSLCFLGCGLLGIVSAVVVARHQRVTPDDEYLNGLGVERVLVVRLERAAERTQQLVQEAAQQGIPLEFLNATDGREDLRFRSQVLPSFSPQSTCTDLIGAIFHSHERAWRKAAAASKPTIVTEDDVRFPNNFSQIYKARAQQLPDDWDMAFLGTSISSGATRYSSLLVRPDTNDPNAQAVLGFWGYAISPKGAQRLLKLADSSRRGRRSFQPVDLFVSHRLKSLEVFAFEPTKDLAEEFARNPDRHHVLSTMRQVGILSLRQFPSTNAPTQDEEASKIEKLNSEIMRFGQSKAFEEAIRSAWRALRIMRRYSCWASKIVLENFGVVLIRMLASTEGSSPRVGDANRTLHVALEAFGSAQRYVQGTWLERKALQEFPSWLQHALKQRSSAGFQAVALPGGSEGILRQESGWLEVRHLRFVETRPLSVVTSLASD